MGNEEVKLLSFFASPFGKRVEWALKLKGVEYEYIEQDIFNKSNLLLELNPVYKKVPVLVHARKPIAESFVIVEYVDETWKQCPLLPQDPYQRALARFWANLVEQKLLDAAWIAMCTSGDDQQNAVKVGRELMEKMEEEIKGKKFFGGDNIGYLDIALGWISYWLPVWEEVGSMQIIEPLKFPAITAWMTNFLSHPVIKDNLPPRDKMLVYFHSRRKALSSTFLGWFKEEPRKEQGDSTMLMGTRVQEVESRGYAKEEPRMEQGDSTMQMGTRVEEFESSGCFEEKEIDEILSTLLVEMKSITGTYGGEITQCSIEDNSGRCGSIMFRKSTTTILNEIMAVLTQPNIVIIGIYGTSNANRENVVEKVDRRVKKDGLFNMVVKTSVMKKPELKRIQGELGNALGLQLHEKTLEERATRLCERIKMEDKILIILDHLQAEINLAKIGIPFGNDHKGCKILLVAHNKELLSDKMKTQKEIYVDELTRNR